MQRIRPINWTRAARTAVLFATGLLAGGAPAAAELLAHRAVYDVTLAAARAQSVTDVDGRMEFVWKDVCDGWVIEYRARLSVAFAERGVRDMSWRYSAWESDDGRRFRYFLRRFSNGKETELLRGEARLTPGKGGKAQQRAPEERSFKLPKDTLLPKAHTEAVLDTARAGEKFLFRHVFDGTGDGGGLFAVNAVVLDAATGKPPARAMPLVRDVPSWRVHLAFYSPDEPNGTPESEQTVRLFANGVVSDLKIDYGDFTIDGELSEIERLALPDCR